MIWNNFSQGNVYWHRLIIYQLRQIQKSLHGNSSPLDSCTHLQMKTTGVVTGVVLLIYNELSLKEELTRENLTEINAVIYQIWAISLGKPTNHACCCAEVKLTEPSCSPSCFPSLASNTWGTLRGASLSWGWFSNARRVGFPLSTLSPPLLHVLQPFCPTQAKSLPFPNPTVSESHEPLLQFWYRNACRAPPRAAQAKRRRPVHGTDGSPPAGDTGSFGALAFQFATSIAEGLNQLPFTSIR